MFLFTNGWCLPRILQAQRGSSLQGTMWKRIGGAVIQWGVVLLQQWIMGQTRYLLLTTTMKLPNSQRLPGWLVKFLPTNEIVYPTSIHSILLNVATDLYPHQFNYTFIVPFWVCKSPSRCQCVIALCFECSILWTLLCTSCFIWECCTMHALSGNYFM